MRVFMTGTSGFLGRPTARQLAAAGHEVAALVRPDTDPARFGDVADALTLISGSLEDMDSLRAPLSAFAPDTVIHAGWSDVSGAGRNAPAQLRNAVVAAELATLVSEVGVGAFIGIGSQAEYGPMTGAADETHPTRPTSLYGVAKLSAALATEQICLRAGLRWSWLRLFCAYGPRDNPSFLIPTVMRNLVAGECPPLTACTQKWDFLHVDDAAAAVVAVATAPAAAGPFNLGSGEAPPLADTLSLLRDLIDPALPLGFGALPYRPEQLMHLQADIGRLHHATGWRPRLTLAEGLSSTLRWYSSQARDHSDAGAWNGRGGR